MTGRPGDDLAAIIPETSIASHRVGRRTGLVLRQGSEAGTAGTIGGQATNRPAGWRWTSGLSIQQNGAFQAVGNCATEHSQEPRPGPG